MQISTANIDDILSELDTDDDPSLNSLAQALRAIVIDIANAVYAQDSLIDELERRLKKLEWIQNWSARSLLSNKASM